MNRLTIKLDENYGPVLPPQDPLYDRKQQFIDAYESITNKLGQLEDLEEGLGISFEVFIKAMLHGICIRIDDGIMDFNNVVGWLWRFDRNPNYVGTERPLEYHFDIILGSVKSFYLKDYGKTWALTKEELL